MLHVAGNIADNRDKQGWGDTTEKHLRTVRALPTPKKIIRAVGLIFLTNIYIDTASIYLPHKHTYGIYKAEIIIT